MAGIIAIGEKSATSAAAAPFLQAFRIQ